MPKFKTLQGEVLDLGIEGTYTQDNEIAFILSLDKQLRSADLNNKEDVVTLKTNINTMAQILEIDLLPVNGAVDDTFKRTVQYIDQNMDLFKKHGITEHINAKKLEKTTNPAFTETEYPPTIEEMKALEVNIGKLYNES